MTMTTSSPAPEPVRVTVGPPTQYDEVAESYDRLIRPRYDAIARLVRDAALRDGPLDSAVVIELSAGTGALTHQLAPHVGGYVATDVSRPMLAVARRRSTGASRVAWVRADVEDVPLPGGLADVVVSSLGPVQDTRAGLAEARRVTSPGGRLVACTWGDDYAELALLQQARRRLGLPPRPTTSAADLVSRARAAGFREVGVRPVRLPVTHASLDAYADYRAAFGAVPLPEGLTTADLLLALRTAASAYVDSAGRVVLDWHLLVLTARA